MPARPKPPAGRRPRLLYLIKRSHSVAKLRLDEITQAHGLSGGEYTMLSFLKGMGPCSAADLARAIHITPQAATQQVLQLEAKQMVHRYENDANRRITLIEITAPAIACLAVINRGVDKIERDMLAGLSPEQIDTVHAFLTRAAIMPADLQSD